MFTDISVTVHPHVPCESAEVRQSFLVCASSSLHTTNLFTTITDCYDQTEEVKLGKVGESRADGEAEEDLRHVTVFRSPLRRTVLGNMEISP